MFKNSLNATFFFPQKIEKHCFFITAPFYSQPSLAALVSSTAVTDNPGRSVADSDVYCSLTPLKAEGWLQLCSSMWPCSKLEVSCWSAPHVPVLLGSRLKDREICDPHSGGKEPEIWWQSTMPLSHCLKDLHTVTVQWSEVLCIILL